MRHGTASGSWGATPMRPPNPSCPCPRQPRSQTQAPTQTRNQTQARKKPRRGWVVGGAAIFDGTKPPWPCPPSAERSGHNGEVSTATIARTAQHLQRSSLTTSTSWDHMISSQVTRGHPVPIHPIPWTPRTVGTHMCQHSLLPTLGLLVGRARPALVLTTHSMGSTVGGVARLVPGTTGQADTGYTLQHSHPPCVSKLWGVGGMKPCPLQFTAGSYESTFSASFSTLAHGISTYLGPSWNCSTPFFLA